MASKSCVFRFGDDVEVREREFTLIKAGDVVPVEPKAFRVLLILLRNPQKLIPKEELLNAVWGDAAVTENSLTRSIALLRRLLGDDTRNPRYIETVATVGYRFLSKVEVAEESGESTLTPVASHAQNPRPAAAPAAPFQPFARSSAQAPTRKTFLVAGLVVVVVLALVWLLRPLLPPPRVTFTTQLTHDRAFKVFPHVARMPLVSDGSRIYFHEITPTIWPLTQVSIDGGETTHIDVPLPPYDLADIAPDGRELLLGAWPPPHTNEDLQLWRFPIASMQPRRVGTVQIDWMAATLSPDGDELYYSLGSNIFAADANGGNPHKLFHAAGGPFWLRVSPDKRLIRFSEGDPEGLPRIGHFSLWEARTDGTRVRQLFPGFSNGDSLCCGNWTPNGKYFVFQSIHGEVSTMWAVREAGDLWHKVNHEPVQLTHEELGAECPLPSKDGKKIFFIGTLRRGEAMRYDLKSHTMAPFLKGFSAYGMSFTKDGERMAYISYPEQILWQSKVNGTDRRQLTFPPMMASLPRWSPDGSQIAFTGSLAGRPNQVFVIPAEGGTPEQLTSGDVESSDATWSPDSNSIAYAGPWAPGPTTYPIHILDLKTRQVMGVPGSEGFFSPRWSPDGRYLLATPLGTGGFTLYDFNTRIWQQLLAGKDGGGWPNWTPDGKCVYYNAPSAKGSPEFRVCLADRKPEKVADMAQEGTLAFEPLGGWTGLAPDGSILVLRDISTEEIYALDWDAP